jgi:hypothetical protein
MGKLPQEASSFGVASKWQDISNAFLCQCSNGYDG